jgi:hypothetical protein
MISKLTYIAMSTLVGWHTVAIWVAPAPESSELVQSVRQVLHPYLTLFRLDNKWDFFAPTVWQGVQFRYVIEDNAGEKHTFVPINDLNRYHPISRRFVYWYDEIIEWPETYGDYVTGLLCRKHAALHPISITLIGIEQGDFSPADHLSGKHPLDAEFVTETTLKNDKCPAS